MKEEYEVGSKNTIPEGKYCFTIVNVSKKILTEKGHYRFWKLITIVDGYEEEVSILLVPWKAVELLSCLGYEPEIVEKNGIKKNVISWDPDEVVGKRFYARLFINLNGYSELIDYEPNIAKSDNVLNNSDIPF